MNFLNIIIYIIIISRTEGSPISYKKLFLNSIKTKDVNQFQGLLSNNFISTKDLDDAANIFILASWKLTPNQRLAFLNALIHPSILYRLSPNALKDILEFSFIHSLSRTKYILDHCPWILDTIPSLDLVDILSPLMLGSEDGNAWNVYLQIQRKQELQDMILKYLADSISQYEEWETVRSALLDKYSNSQRLRVKLADLTLNHFSKPLPKPLSKLSTSSSISSMILYSKRLVPHGPHFYKNIKKPIHLSGISPNKLHLG